MQKHLNFKQIMNASVLSQRVSPTHIQKHFGKEFDLEKDYTLTVNNVKKVLYGTFEEHMKWWKARSEQIISEVENKDQFMNDLSKIAKNEYIHGTRDSKHYNSKGYEYIAKVVNSY